MTLTVDGLLLAYHRFRSLYFTALVWEVWRNSRALFLLVTLFPYLQGHICTRYCEASHNGTLNSSVRSTAKCWYSSYCKRRNWWMWRVAFWYPLAINCHHFLMWTGNTPLSLADICSQNGISLADILLAISCHFTCWYRLAISRYHLLIYLFSKWHNSCWYLAGNKLSFHLLISTGNKPLSLADIFLFSKWHITCWYLSVLKMAYHLLISIGNKPLSLADIFLFSKWHITCWYLSVLKMAYHLLISTGNKPLSLADIFLFSKWHITCWYRLAISRYHLLTSFCSQNGISLADILLAISCHITCWFPLAISCHITCWYIYIYIYVCVCVCVCVCGLKLTCHLVIPSCRYKDSVQCAVFTHFTLCISTARLKSFHCVPVLSSFLGLRLATA